MSLKCQLQIFKIQYSFELKKDVEYRHVPLEIDLNSTGSKLHLFTEWVEFEKWQSLMAICKNDNGTVHCQFSLYDRAKRYVEGTTVEKNLKDLIKYMQQHPGCGAWHIYLYEAKIAKESKVGVNLAGQDTLSMSGQNGELCRLLACLNEDGQTRR
jgi:hypothetical protein